jgi:glycosyltransferase involved in cell wall biosynthesis
MMVDQSPLVSIIIPCYNQGVYLEEAVDSVLNQTYQNTEIIIVNDGSTDSYTNTLLSNYNKPRTRIIIIENQGLAGARNAGIRVSQGKYILPLDGDDKIAPEYIAEAVNILENKPSVKLVYCEAEYFGAKSGKWELPEYSYTHLFFGNMIFCSAVYRKVDFDATDGYDTNMKYGWEDWEFWLRLLESDSEVYRIPFIRFYYRIKDNSMITSLSESEAKMRELRQYVYAKHWKLFQQHVTFISVIIPNYNHAIYLPKRIESILNQTFPFFELILMDDCSSDNSREIIADYAAKDQRIRVIYNEQNSGSTFKQWNKGIRESKGKYIWIAESDDYAEVYFLEKLVPHLINNQGVGIAYCQSWNIDQHDKIHGTWEQHTEELDENMWKADFLMNGKILVGKYMFYRNIIPNASAAIFRKDLYEQAGGADESFRLNGDWILWAKILLVSDLVFLSDKLNYFRTHTQNVRSNSGKQGLALEELSRVMVFIHGEVAVNRRVFYKMIDAFSNTWIIAIMYNSISKERNRTIFKNVKLLEPAIERILIKKFVLNWDLFFQLSRKKIAKRTNRVKNKFVRVLRSKLGLSLMFIYLQIMVDHSALLS